MARRKARELAFQALFQAQRGDHPLWEVWHDVRVSAAEQLDDDDDDAVYGDPLDHESLEFAQQLLQQFADHQAEVDEVLSSSLKGWTFSQMSQTDVTILRLAVSEFRYFADIPAEVTIEVAVRIAKKFGGEESGRFVNGVLARLMNTNPQNANPQNAGAHNTDTHNTDSQNTDVQKNVSQDGSGVDTSSDAHNPESGADDSSERSARAEVTAESTTESTVENIRADITAQGAESSTADKTADKDAAVLL